MQCSLNDRSCVKRVDCNVVKKWQFWVLVRVVKKMQFWMVLSVVKKRRYCGY